MTRHIEPLFTDRQSKEFRLDYPHFIPPPQLDTGRQTKTTTTATWESTLEKSIKSIVSIKAMRVRGLDTEVPGSYTATGFVVDPERGIILSNRHVVSVSPITAYAVFCNYEEIQLKPIYRDPVHDFGFFQYDPTKVRFLDIPGIELYPKGAKIGQDIRVVGNDAGEKLSILSGTLARLDREAPDYGTGNYNDFNTFYYQAASSTSSGSSGSPVLDIQGRAIALNAGGASTSSSSYYLPLDRAQRALALIQKGCQEIPRGSLQTTFEYQSYDALVQLGLSRHLEKRLRAGVNEGLLVVKSVLPEGPAFGLLESGDILLTCNGQLLPKLFIDLEEQLDTAVEQGQEVNVVVSRAGELKQVQLPVQSLHETTPHRYLEFGGGVLIDVSYQIAKSYGLSLKDAGVYVSAAGFILGRARVLRKSVIVGINNKQVRSLDEFISVISEIEQGERVPIHFYSLSKPMKIKVMIIHVDWRWHKFQIATRNDTTGLWDYKPLKNRLNKSPAITENRETSIQYTPEKEPQDPIKRLSKSIVSIDCYPPFIVDGSRNAHSYGAGVIISMDPPLILCDRDTVPLSISVITVTFENSITVPASLVFLHPFYNFAVLKFDPTTVLKAGCKINVANIIDADVQEGDQLNYVGLSGRGEVNIKKTTVSSLSPVRTSETLPPRWRAMNLQVFKVSEGTLGSQGGLFADNEGNVKALWMSFSIDGEKHELSSTLGGVPARLVLPTLNKIKSGESLAVRGLDAEFWPLQICNARIIGVPDKWIDKIKETSDSLASVIYVMGITDISSPSGRLLKPGDIVLAINDTVVHSIDDFSYFIDHKELKMTIFRNGTEQELVVPTTEFDGQETTEAVGWQGMVLQDTYTAAKEQVQKKIPEGLFVSCCIFGSPAEASLKPGIWITEVDQIPVKTLQQFLDTIDVNNMRQRRIAKIKNQARYQTNFVQGKEASQLLSLPTQEEIEEDLMYNEDETHIQIKFETSDNNIQVKAMKVDYHYWPTWHLQKNEQSIHGWDMTFK